MIDLHIHSNFSDGKASVFEIARKAKEQNLKAIAIVDHSSELSFGLDEKKAKLRQMEIDDARSAFGIRIYSGIECGINQNGEIFLPVFDFDFIIASVHENTVDYYSRVLKCIERTDFEVLGHPLSEMFEFVRDQKLEEKMLDAMEAYGIALEINSTHRCPPEDLLMSSADRRIMVSIGSDAHRLENVGRIEWCEERRKKYLRRAEIFLP